MFCSKCGAQIPDESNFCLKCGESLDGKTQAHSHFTDLPPKIISDVGIAFTGPQKKSFFGKTLSTAAVYFELLDESRRPTRCLGTAKIHILQRIAGNLLIPDSKQVVFKTTIDVKLEGFRQSRNDPNYFGFFYHTEQPILQEGNFYYVDVWLKTITGLELYGSDKM